MSLASYFSCEGASAGHREPQYVETRLVNTCLEMEKIVKHGVHPTCTLYERLQGEVLFTMHFVCLMDRFSVASYWGSKNVNVCWENHQTTFHEEGIRFRKRRLAVW